MSEQKNDSAKNTIPDYICLSIPVPNQNKGGLVLPSTAGISQTISGMTLRDYFAAKATSEDIDSFMYKRVKDQQPFMPAFYAVMSREEAKYAYADAMLKARG